MNKVISWLQSNRLRQILTVFLLALTFLFSTAFGDYGNQLQAQAEPVTPEAVNYRVDSAADEARRNTENIKEATQDTGKNIFENIKEKLNLDEPIDPGTKQVVEQVKEAASDVVKAPQRAVQNATK